MYEKTKIFKIVFIKICHLVIYLFIPAIGLFMLIDLQIWIIEIIILN